MRFMNEYISTTPFDLYELSLFHLVAKHRSFTKAAEAAGLTQSAVTRQMQGIENGLGVDLLERTTRAVKLTRAGEALYRDSAIILGNVDQAMRRMREDFSEAKKEIRLAVSQSVAMAHLPGLFHANLRKNPEVGMNVKSLPSAAIFEALESDDLDLGVVCATRKLPKGVRVTHRFRDAFVMIAPTSVADEFAGLGKSKKGRWEWLCRQSWLLIEECSNTGQALRRWMAKQGIKVEPAMQLESFDLIINLVALGLGVAFVPMRALALYSRKKQFKRVILPERFERELVVLAHGRRKVPPHLQAFIENILF